MILFYLDFFHSRQTHWHLWRGDRLNDPETYDRHLPEYIQDVIGANHIAAYKYSPKKYPGKVTLMRVEEQSHGLYDKALYGWQDYVEDVEVHVVPGDYGSMMNEPNVKILAEELQNCIDRTLVNL